ncbi:hypothetical protein DESUT3_09060 [Desulfuromonas versatilis]|uniref:Uncharacterized protein n=1 Tax=Desulfuromonas versatilis TaxID=2802975 RepID=A0ABN6DUT2_9BACT|nr:hypothetical protein [Desulfuromonas versatilis]BCR03837.1 hypothetical protein DESUT3_09060 [Desulfuromonas versatilis]
MDRKKKLAVAMAAVRACLEAEQQGTHPLHADRRRPAVWSMSGRLAQAQLSSLMQVKATR